MLYEGKRHDSEIKFFIQMVQSLCNALATQIQTRLSWSITIRAISYNQEITPTTVYGVRVEKIDEPTTVCVEYKCP